MKQKGKLRKKQKRSSRDVTEHENMSKKNKAGTKREKKKNT